MTVRTAAGRIRNSLAMIGLAHTLHDLALRAANRALVIKILRGMTAERVNADYLACREPYRSMFLDEKRLRGFGRDPANDLPESFLDEALAQGDECYGILDGELLAAYGWYSRRPTPIDPPDLLLDPGDRYVYMYKGFTHPGHRGRRRRADSWCADRAGGARCRFRRRGARRSDTSIRVRNRRALPMKPRP